MLPASEWGPSSVTFAHVHFIVLKLCNSAGLIYEGCISSRDPCWYRTHYFPFMCLCQRATGNQLLETDLKKKKNQKTSQHNAKTFIIVIITSQVPVPAYSLCKEGNGDSGCRLCHWCEETKMKSSNFPLGQGTGISEPKHIPTTKQQ